MGISKEFLLPDIGDFEAVDVVEVLVAPGDRVEAEDALIVLESDKATMEVPSPFSGTIRELRVRVGDQVSAGDLLCVIDVDVDGGASDEKRAVDAASHRPTPPEASRRPPEPSPAAPEIAAAGSPTSSLAASPAAHSPAGGLAHASSSAGGRAHASSPAGGLAHASPSVRHLARELGVDLTRVHPSGPKGRILRTDVQQYVKSRLDAGPSRASGAPGGAVETRAEIDFSKFGAIEVQPLSRIRRLSARHLHHSWVTVPHVTQFDEADVTDLEAFRASQRPSAAARGVKLTFLPFLIRATSAVLKEFPRFNASLDATGENLILKRYVHMGVAVDTDQGLVVPVVRDADRKGLLELASELQDLGERARARRLGPEALQGSSFTISSLGGIGGTRFTPIIHHPEVAILGASRMQWQPVYREQALERRRILPLSLSYDHRVIDGAEAARFTTRLCQVLSDLRLVLM
ncbi:MAG: 2-oxo acid dehydrogenase subunit E2 [Myxococcota bacterium]